MNTEDITVRGFEWLIYFFCFQVTPDNIDSAAVYEQVTPDYNIDLATVYDQVIPYYNIDSATMYERTITSSM